MVEWSAELGSDITFFLSCGTAYCTGRGEIMDPIHPPLQSGSTKLCIVKPNIGLSTPSVFQALNYDELSTLNADDVLLPSFVGNNNKNNNTTKEGSSGSTSSIMDQVPKEYFVNDLEPPAFRCIPELQQLKEELLSVPGFFHVMMSGSGTSIFCLGEPTNQKDFIQQMETYQERHNSTMAVQTYYFTEFLSRSPNEWYHNPKEDSSSL